MNCPRCGASSAATMKFCGECGAKLPVVGPADEGERRQITVLFVDLVGSTAISNEVDPETLRDVYDAYHSACAEAIEGHGGHIAQYLGDGILAYFGYPRAREDDALQAVRSALSLRERLASLEVQGIRLRPRVGVHTGLVVLADVGGARKERLATGRAPNLAAHIQAAADPGMILISEATRALVDGHMVLEDHGLHQLKGLSDRVRLHAVTGAQDLGSRFEARASVGLTPFVGRSAEIDAVRRAWLSASAGMGRTVVFRGEAGIGKSRLLGLVRDVARNGDEPTTIDAECSPYHINEPLFPIARMIGRLDGGREEEATLRGLERLVESRRMDVEAIVPLLAHLFSVETGARYRPPDVPPLRLRERSMEALADLLLRGTNGGVSILLLEDLHWADPSTLELLNALVAAQVDVPHMMVCTTRPEGAALESDAGNCSELWIGPLPNAESRDLVSSVLGGKPLPVDVSSRIAARTGGVPLFIEAVTRTVREAGLLREAEDQFELSGPLPDALIPTTVQDSLMARIDALGAARSVAQLGATIGRQFSLDLLRFVFRGTETELSAALDELVAMNIVSRSADDSIPIYTFEHALVQDAAYNSLLRRTRQDYHGLIADTLVKQFPARAEAQPELLARHYEGAGKAREAIDQYLKGGGAAAARSAMAESVAHLQRAVDLLQTLPEDEPWRLDKEMQAQLALAPALTGTVGWGSPEVERACTRARDLCLTLDNQEGLLAARWVLWSVYLLRGETIRSQEAAQPVWDMAIESGDPALLLAARHAVGFSRYFHGELHEAAEHGEKARELWDPDREQWVATTFGLPSSISCGVFHFQSLWFLGYPERAEARYREVWAYVDALDTLLAKVYGLGVTVWLPYAKRDVDTIEPWAQELYDLCDDQGFLLWRAQASMYRGWAWSMRGRPDEGVEEIRRGWKEYNSIGSAVMAPQIHLMTAEALRAGDRLDEALDELNTAKATVAALAEHAWEPELYRLTGEIHSGRGDWSTAEDQIRRAIELARSQDAKMLELLAATSLTRLLGERGRREDGRSVLRPVYEWFQEGHDTPELHAARAELG